MRIGILSVFLALGAGVVVRRAFELQVERTDTLREMAEEQYLRDIRLAPKRGTIFDRHGAELAVSVDVDSAWANPRQLKAENRDPVETARLLATVLDIDEARIAARLSSDRYFVWIKRRLTPQQAAQVNALDINGVYMEREARRFYPNRELASHLLGYANVDGEGIEGLELFLDEELRGSVDTVPAIRDRRGAVVFSEQLLDHRAAQGDDITLTIDKTIQHIAEEELSMAVRTFEARAGSVVVMDPRNGELLAVANYPTFNPNHPGRFEAGMRRNRAVTDRFEPGSTVKPFTIAGALAANTIRPNQLVDCQDGKMEVGDFTIHDTHRWGELTPAQILMHSSNIGTAKIGASMGRQGLFRTFRRFGFGDVTGLPLPGETQGILRHYRRWYEMDAATIAFGQGVSVTNVQLATAMSAIANGGRLMRPVLVRRVADAHGETVEETLPRVRRQVVPRSVARLVADMMTTVTGPDGTGTEASIDGYLVAGKTGTAQKADYVGGGYAEDRWLVSFVGFVPAEDPRLVISVVVDEPVIATYGGAVAGPVFRRVGAAGVTQQIVTPRLTASSALAVRQATRQGLGLALMANW
ncbi:MAG: penicillin-binding transpeptidase domain-containing protein, partial [Myxococcota bacterium]